ncbi:MAG: hypothetical protein E7E73_00185 [Negativicoccus succinicivorans]|nr:hypothetical protein [Negativicoccus succinicivorans]
MTNLEHYGLDLLQDDAVMQYLIDQKPESISEITDILFEQARANGTLTFSTVDAAKELFDAHPLNEIIEEFQEFPVDANTLNEEVVHVYFAEKDFTDMLCNEYEDREYPQDMTDSEKMLAIIFDVSVENGLGLEKEHAEIALAGLHAHTPEDFIEMTDFTSLETLPDDFKNYQEFIDCVNSENENVIHSTKQAARNEIRTMNLKEFNKEQRREIESGQKSGVDVTIYADPKLNWAQMHEIRWGLQDGLDASLYADLKYDSDQMQQIRLGLEDNLNVSIYADLKYEADQMSEIRFGLQDRLDVSAYADPKYNADQMRQIRWGLEKNLDVSIYADPKFNEYQMLQIRAGLEQGIDVSVYADKKYDHNQMYQIFYGLKSGVDARIYADPKYDWEQMREIYQGLESGVDTSIYADPKYNSGQMEQLRLGLCAGVDVSAFADPEYNYEQMQVIRFGLEEGFEFKEVRPAVQLNKSTGKGLER